MQCRGRDSSVGKSFALHAGDLDLNPNDLGHQRGLEITNCKSHIAPVSLTDWLCTMILFKKKGASKGKLLIFVSEIGSICTSLRNGLM